MALPPLSLSSLILCLSTLSLRSLTLAPLALASLTLAPLALTSLTLAAFARHLCLLNTASVHNLSHIFLPSLVAVLSASTATTPAAAVPATATSTFAAESLTPSHGGSSDALPPPLLPLLGPVAPGAGPEP
eukprot:CAMPEP_0119104158 /NCGR_PEP_ID=MMETSP1180-20130426/2442_1 /TAXON_ID=3052 ORGANISM="Chlamydomonas cf sp, Strain CCMP681" /NCGR_SAMPLE_ID=MMETSP1180 /ASSEMBLY_ACC=CAM_ASM_000741 /LENGTH=130 /DNA_ID=CAMNT_0007088839 /DNA_START=624 /DNA_END=1014 /DNA_ORIENTATION=-